MSFRARHTHTTLGKKKVICQVFWVRITASILYKSTAGRYRPVRVADRPITAHCRFIKNAYWDSFRQFKYTFCWFTSTFYILHQFFNHMIQCINLCFFCHLVVLRFFFFFFFFFSFFDQYKDHTVWGTYIKCNSQMSCLHFIYTNALTN